MRKVFLSALVVLFISSCTSLFYTGYSPSGFSATSSAAMGLTPTEDPSTGLYGYLSDFGVWAITPQYLYAGNFNDGMARVETRTGYGIINTLGKWVVQPVFRSGSDCDGAAQSIRKGRLPGVELWLAEDRTTGLYGYLNHYGAWHIKPQYEDGSRFYSDGYAIVKQRYGRWGVINRSNEWLVRPSFDSRYKAEAAVQRLMR
ncbi:MAG: WG repeat-containing protein [Bacteroidales bacterium]|nr:WG repeat-containing protein [Bacteroidales bacterium]